MQTFSSVAAHATETFSSLPRQPLGDCRILSLSASNTGGNIIHKEVIPESRFPNDGVVTLPVPTDGDTVWLSQVQIAELFGKDQSVISRHIRNAVSDGEIDISANYAKYAYVAENVTKVKEIEFYDLDVIISVGYRVPRRQGSPRCCGAHR